METRRYCLVKTSVILFLSFVGHVTHAFILFAPAGYNSVNKNNFTVLDIADNATLNLINDDVVGYFPDRETSDASSPSSYVYDEMVTLIHDTREPLHKTTRHSPKNSSNNHQSARTPTKNTRSSDYSSGKSRRWSHDSTPNVTWEKLTSKSGNLPGTGFETKEKSVEPRWNLVRAPEDAGRFPGRFVREEIIQMPEPPLPPGHSSLPSQEQKRSRVKRRARPSVIVRVPSSRYWKSSVQTTVSARKTRVDAQVGVLVVADYSVYADYLKANANNHAVAVARIRRYYGMLFAMMNQRFQTIKDPYLSITVTISGILIAERRSDSPWTEDIVDWSNKRYHGRASVDTGKSLRGFSRWLAGKEGLPEFDHAMAFTAYRLTGPYGVGLGGMAYLEAVCDTKSGNAVSIVGDKGDFQSVRVATHELAHSLGAIHDGDRGAEACPSRDAFIMSSMTSPNQRAPLRNAFYFSKCSIRDINRHLSKSRSSCVRDKPLVYYNYDLERFPPGHVYTPDSQCKLIFGSRSMFCGEGNLANVMCGQLWCRDPNRNNGCRSNSYLTALPGTPCGQSGVCSLGECVPGKSKQDANHKTRNTGKIIATSRIGTVSSRQTNSRFTPTHKGSTVSSDRTIGRVGTVAKSGVINRDRTADKENTINRGSALPRFRTINGDSIINRDSLFHRGSLFTSSRTPIRDRISNIGSSNSRGRATSTNRDVTNKRDRTSPTRSTVNRDRIINGDRTIIRDRRIIMDTSISRPRAISTDRAILNVRDTNRGSPINRFTTVTNDRAINRDRTVPSDRAISRDRTITNDRVTSRDRAIISDRANSRDKAITNDRSGTIGRTKTRDRAINQNRIINGERPSTRGSTNNKGSTVNTASSPNTGISIKVGGGNNKNSINSNNIPNIYIRERNNIPRTPKPVRTSYRTRKQQTRRRHRFRPRSRSGSRRTGRKQKRRRGKRKNRCREDKNTSYCRDLLSLNPRGCRRRAIRQYCCATCRKLRRSKNKTRRRK